MASFGRILGASIRHLKDLAHPAAAMSRRALDAVQTLADECATKKQWQTRPPASAVAARLAQLICDEKADAVDAVRSRLRSDPCESLWDDVPERSELKPTVPSNSSDRLGADGWALKLYDSQSQSTHMVRIATFNTHNTKLEDLQRVKTLGDFVRGKELDIVALQELRGTVETNVLKQRLEEALGDQYQVVLSERLGTPATERAAFCYRHHLVRLMSANVLRVAGVTEDWPRLPFFGKFRVGNTRFLVGSVHFAPTNKRPELQAKVVPALFDWIKDERLAHADTNLLFVGDFNLGATNPIWDEFRKLGWRHCLPATAFTNSTDKKQWDNVFALASKNKVVSSHYCASGRRLSDHALVWVCHEYVPGSLVDETAEL